MSILKKTNAPYLVSGALAIVTLLASGVLAVAPYVGFLAPVAALSLGLPFIVGGAIFSIAAIALSYAAVSKNNTISEKEAQLANQTKEIEGKNSQVASQKEIILKSMEEISELETQLANQAEGIEGKDSQVASQERIIFERMEEISELKRENSELKAQLNERDKKIEKDALKVAIADGVIWSAKGAANGAIWSAKGVINGAWYVCKCTYNNLPSKERLSSSLQSAKDIQRASQEAFVTVKKACSSGRLLGIFKRDLTDAYNACGTYVSSTWGYVGEKGGTPIGCEDQDVFYDAESGDEEDQDIFYDAESDDEKDTKVSSLKEQLDEKGETNVYNNALDANLLHTQHKNTLTNTPQGEVEISKVEQKKAQKPEEQADRKLKDNSVNNQEQGSKNKRSGAARKKGKRTQVQHMLYAVETSNRLSCLSPNQECP